MAEAKPNLILCPYCGMFNKAPVTHCTSCHGHFDSLSRKVSQQHMGPWFIRDMQSPFRPGCSFDVIEKLCMSGKIKGDTILRGPTTRQFWQVAWRVPGVAHLIGFCHKCEEKLPGLISNCPHCGVTFARPSKREELGLDGYDPTVFEEVRRVRESTMATAAGAAPAAAATSTMASAPAASGGTVAGTATFQGAGGVASMISDNQAGAEDGAGAVDDELAAMAWMTSSGEYHSEALPAERPAGGISPVVIGLITLNLLLIAVVAAVMMIDQGSETDTGFNTGTGTLIEPPAGTPQKARPKPRNPSPAGVTTPDPNTTTNPTPQVPAGHSNTPTPTIDNGDGGASLFAPTPTPTKAPPRNSGPSFFGIPIHMTPVEGLTEEQAADFNQRFARAQAFYKDSNYREALRLLESIRSDLPFGVTNKGLDESIRQTEAAARQKAEDAKEPAPTTPAPAPAPDAPQTKTPTKPTEAQKKALDAFFE